MAVVIKLGGHALTTDEAQRELSAAVGDVARAGHAPVVVHGGGPMIARALERAGITTRFARGLRVTTPESLPIVESELTLLNKRLAHQIGSAIGLTGRDARVLVAEPLDAALGMVGRITFVNQALLEGLVALGVTPVLACLAANDAADGVLNVNADSAAGAVAGALSAPAVFITNVAGVLDRVGEAASLLPKLTTAEAKRRIADGRIADGMIPKVEAAFFAIEQGAPSAVIAGGDRATALADVVAGRAGTRLLP